MGDPGGGGHQRLRLQLGHDGPRLLQMLAGRLGPAELDEAVSEADQRVGALEQQALPGGHRGRCP